MDFCDLRRQYSFLRKPIDESIAKVLEHGLFINGPEIKELEEKLGNYVGKHAVAVSSGTDALLVSLMALDIKPGDYVVTVPFTFAANVETILMLGAKPLFVDINPDDFMIDADKLTHFLENPVDPKTKEKIESGRIKAMIIVDLYGDIADYEKIEELAKKHNIMLIEDAAQAFGAEANGKKAGAYGDIALTSFFPSKPLGGYGDGGMVFTGDANMAEKIRKIRNHGQEGKYIHEIFGMNFRMDTLQAAVILAKFNEFDNELEKRRKVAAFYDENLKELEDKGVLKLPRIKENNKSAYAQYSILAENREEFVKHLREKDIPSAIHYPKALHLQNAFSDTGYVSGDFPMAEEISGKIISLPLDAYKTEEELGEICKAIKDFY